jgi:hypothetical protein
MLLVVLAAAALMVGCSGGDDGTARTLFDGSAVREAPVSFEGIENDVVVTSQALVPTASLDPESAAGSCVEQFDHEFEGAAVLRLGVATETVTARETHGRAVLGCDNSTGEREDHRRWCGGAYGNVDQGRLTDPRLSIGCRASDGRPVGFIWVEPTDRTRYVAVEQPDYTEVYEVAGGLPIRIATVSGVDVETSSATFEISQYDADGRRLRELTLEAFVAG